MLRRGIVWFWTAALLCTLGMPAHACLAYVTNDRDNTVSVADLAQMKTIKAIPAGPQRHGITMTKDGSELSVVDVADLDVVKSIQVGRLPWGVVGSPT